MVNRALKNSKQEYIPSLDGLRALAIVPVLLFHLNVNGFSLGWLGVNLFFVISGFLITGILLDTKNSPRYFRNFYCRRALRIFPIYYLSLLAIICLSVRFRWSISDSPYYVFYLQNCILGSKSWQADFPAVFNHTWSLAIEEQFYLLWPVIIYVFGRRFLYAIVVTFFCTSALFRLFVYQATDNPNYLFVLLPTQLDCLSAGAFIALVTRSKKISDDSIAKYSLYAVTLSGIGSAIIIWIIGLTAYWTPVAWGTRGVNLLLLPLAAVFFGGLVSYTSHHTSVITSFLSLTPVRHIGKISYGMYLYHYPIFLLAPAGVMRLFPWSQGFLEVLFIKAILLVSITYLASLLSWNLLEVKFIGLKKHFVS